MAAFKLGEGKKERQGNWCPGFLNGDKPFGTLRSWVQVEVHHLIL